MFLVRQKVKIVILMKSLNQKPHINANLQNIFNIDMVMNISER